MARDEKFNFSGTVEVSPGAIPFSRSARTYLLRPDLTNKTQEKIDSDFARVLGSEIRKLHKSPLPVTPAPAGFGRGVSPRVSGSGPSFNRLILPRGIHVRLQETASWLTPSGVAKKRRQLERKGIPDLKGRRFITLTLDRSLFGDCALTAYLAGKDRLRRFLEEGRLAGLWDRGSWWAWKLEFQKDGWAHWHYLLDRTNKFNRVELDKIGKIWGYGRTNVRRISKSDFGYHFKYAFKGVFQDDSEGSGLCVPKWFLDYYCAFKDGKKPLSFGRARFWQTSKGFYTGVPLPDRKKSIPESSILPLPVRLIIDYRNSTIVVIARRWDGGYEKAATLSLGVTIEQFIRRHLWDVDHGYGCTLSFRSFVLDPATLNQLIDKNQQWKLQQLLSHNRMSLKQAQSFRRNHQTLQHC